MLQFLRQISLLVCCAFIFFILFWFSCKFLYFLVCLRFRLGVGGVFHGHDENWIAGFTHFANGGDELLVELRAIQFGIAACYDLGYTHFICESDCLKAIDLILNVTNVSLHVYVYVLLEIPDVLHHGTINLVHIPREQNICADFMAKKGAHSASSAQLTGIVLQMAWSLFLLRGKLAL